MGQYWKFVNIDKRKQLAHESGVRLREMLGYRCLEPLVGLLRRPQWVPYLAPSYSIRTCKLKSLESPLISLPQEVIEQIVSLLVEDEEPGGEDLICLALTCSYFFRLLGPQVQTILADDEAPWAGDRLIFVGDYANGIPEGVVTEAERHQLVKMARQEYENHFEVDEIAEMMSEDSNLLYDAITEEVAERGAGFERFHRNDPREVEIFGGIFSRAQKRMVSTQECKKAIDLITGVLQHVPTDASGHPRKRAALLRNLTTKEFVLDDTVAQGRLYYSLGEVLGTFTAWTHDGSGNKALDLPGRWAGHRFDIGCLEDVAEEGWKDVSDEAVDNLENAGIDDEGVGRRAWE
ncbi:unnamed protein product [Clonostachys rosea]|uniref:F-box domain-containing protein n=1 Tax=Bionectria ochroleuca TaxID=29856 RepID=A0ABY6UDJ5_BIOOC|nr:unnamed protein product [Clonostachys rosea]